MTSRAEGISRRDQRPTHLCGTAQTVRVGEEHSAITNVKGQGMNRIIYIVGLVVVVLAVLAFFGLR